MTLANGGYWDFQKIKDCLLEDIWQRIRANPPPNPLKGPDTWRWMFAKNDKLSVKKAHSLISEVESNESSKGWSNIWKWEGHLRIRSFLWLARRGRLSTSALCAQRHVIPSDSCLRCNA
ncbi:hypothetical protein Scep_007288 [Stephania cephalantha]|uniref:Reverse transcriptase zinc-binding domain-containing protein n=1 Tax=Stephania cephalantha TaxID=152367 RepID=A0AAP0K9Q2_9MAGN